jgi:hypothetical protein
MDTRPKQSADRIGLRVDFSPHRVLLSGRAVTSQVAAIDASQDWPEPDTETLTAETYPSEFAAVSVRVG